MQVIEAHPDESLDLQRVEGIDQDLIVKPFNQKGTVTSLREFTINALNLHHGVQADERFGVRQTGSDDFDQDGIPREFTDGDVTALTLFQATLSSPGVCLPVDAEIRSQIEEGQRLFSNCKCSDCHIPELELRSAVFSEPSPYNVRGTIASSNPEETVWVDLSHEMQSPKLARDSSGRFMIRVYSDFKRHAIADNERPYWNNETTEQRLVPSNVFLTKRLWSVGNTAPYGHRGDVSTIVDAISYHGAEANESRAKFDRLSSFEQDCIVKFLKSLQIVPPGESLIREEPEAKVLPYQKEVSQ
jgi:CxxC motif-containing protein (DUF1111 family)